MDQTRRSWTGGNFGELFWVFGYEMTKPWAELIIADDQVQIRVQSVWRVYARAKNLTATRADLESVFPFTRPNKIVQPRYGIGFRRGDGRTFYFTASLKDVEEVIEVLTAQGFPVAPEWQQLKHGRTR